MLGKSSISDQGIPRPVLKKPARKEIMLDSTWWNHMFGTQLILWQKEPNVVVCGRYSSIYIDILYIDLWKWGLVWSSPDNGLSNIQECGMMWDARPLFLHIFGAEHPYNTYLYVFYVNRLRVARNQEIQSCYVKRSNPEGKVEKLKASRIQGRG